MPSNSRVDEPCLSKLSIPPLKPIMHFDHIFDIFMTLNFSLLDIRVFHVMLRWKYHQANIITV